MSQPVTRLSAAFAAGAVGALVNSLAVQLAGQIRPGSAPALTSEWLYPRLVWGGLWGLLLVLPLLRNRPVVRGLLISLAPSLARLTVFAGAPTPIAAVFLFNAIWGIAAAIWYRAAVK
jgi:hypothetical protein